MSVVATIQARMGSSRLPGKVLLETGGKPFLLRQVERIKKSNHIDHIIIATSNNSIDDEIIKLCNKYKIDFYRGSENDVLDRVCKSLAPYKGWVHAEFVGDAPYIDPSIIDEVIEFYLNNRLDTDYVSNGIEQTYPNGCEFNVYEVNTLLECNEMVANDDPLREHVDIHIYKSSRYRSKNIKAPNLLHRPDLYIELDTANDYKVLKLIGDHFHKIGHDDFTLLDIITFLNKNPQIAKINSSEHRKYLEIKGMPIE